MEQQVLDWRHSGLAQRFIAREVAEGFSLVGCEVHFNHYGDRGVVDVLLRKDVGGRWLWWVCELKPILLDVGEAVRQVHRAKTYLRQSRSDLFGEGDRLEFLLVLEAGEHNWDVFRRHVDLFRDVRVLFFHDDKELERRFRNFQEIREAIEVARRSPVAQRMRSSR